jgi:hypothetical protein
MRISAGVLGKSRVFLKIAHSLRSARQPDLQDAGGIALLAPGSAI